MVAPSADGAILTITYRRSTKFTLFDVVTSLHIIVELKVRYWRSKVITKWKGQAQEKW